MTYLNIMFKTILVFIFCLYSHLASAYQSNLNLDSLLKSSKNVFKKSPAMGLAIAKQIYDKASVKHHPIIEVKSLNLISQFYTESKKYDSAKFYSYRALKIAEKYLVDSLKGDSWINLGIIDYKNNLFEQAIYKYTQAASIYKHCNQDYYLAVSNLDIALCYIKISKYKEAIKYYLLAADKFATLKDLKNLSNTYNGIGLSFVTQKDYEKAIFYNIKALAIRKKLKDNPSIAQSFNNIGYSFKQYKKPDSSIFYLSKSIILYQKEKDSSQLILPLQNFGSSYKMKGNLKKAEGYILRSLRIAANYKMEEELARGNLDLSELYTAQKKYAPALVAANITENTAQKLKLPELLMDAYAVKFAIYTKQGDYKKALWYSNKRNIIKDSLFTIAKNKTIDELEIRYQTAQKEKDIAALNLQNKLQNKVVGQQKVSILALAAGAVLLFLLLLIAYNNFRIKNNANKRIQTLMQELHHRVKNNLQILAGLFQMQIDSLDDERTKNALKENELRLASMNLIHNKLYMDNNTTQIAMEEYLTKLLQHIKASFGGNNAGDVDLIVDVEALTLEADKAVAIGLIVNELATNSFKYAFDGRRGQIYLSLKPTGKGQLTLSLRDNGKGISAVHKENRASFGLKLVDLMARQLNAKLVVKNENGVFYQLEMGV